MCTFKKSFLTRLPRLLLLPYLLCLKVAISSSLCAAAIPLEAGNPDPDLSKLIINGHILEGIIPGTQLETIKAAREEVLRGITLLIDTCFKNLGGITLNLRPDVYNSIEENLTHFATAFKKLICTLHDPAAFAIAIEKMEFNKSTPNTDAKKKLMEFMSISPTPAEFDFKTKLIKLATLKDNTKAPMNNTIVARHLWNTCISPECDWLSKAWDELSQQDQDEIQALSDSGSVPFQYLGAYLLFKDTTLNATEKMRGLGTIPTKASRDFWRVLKFEFLSGYYGERNEQEAIDGWISLINSLAEHFPISQTLVFKPIDTSRDPATWPKGYKTALYSLAALEETAPLLDVLRAFTDRYKTPKIANLYLLNYLKESSAQNPTNNAERIAEIERVCTFVPEMNSIKADAIGLFDTPLFTDHIRLDFQLNEPSQRLQVLTELSDQGITDATNYLATAYAQSLNKEAPLAEHLGIQTLTGEQRTFGNIALLHQERTVDLIRLGLKGNRCAQKLLFEKKQRDISIVDELFDNRLALSSNNPLPCKEDQPNMNIMLGYALQFAFNVANILQENQNNVPLYFFEPVHSAVEKARPLR
jgi:hypothetical protein